MKNNKIKTIWFDLDATLYSAESGLWAEIGNRIEQYIENILGYPREQMLSLKMDYYLKYGTTLRGLQLHNNVNTENYLNYVHDIPVQNYIQTDPNLREMLLRLPQKRWVFTNSDLPHTMRVLRSLGITDCFDGYITVESINFQNKPHPEAYNLAKSICGEEDFENILFLDDSLRNLAGAKELGVNTVLVGSKELHPAADYSIQRPHDLQTVFPELFL